MLDFPNSPVIDQTYQGPSGQLWRWTGNMWSAVRRPVLGITDGSNAAPGEVGEFLIQINNNIGLAANTYFTACTLTLSAGDWSCTGSWFCSTGTAATMQAFITTTPLTGLSATELWKLRNTAASVDAAPVATQRFNVAQPTPIYLTVLASATVGVGGASAMLQARRMR